jgi:hypothetical protein
MTTSQALPLEPEPRRAEGGAWDWTVGRKTIVDVAAWRASHVARELLPSPDGERLAAVLETAGEGFIVQVNDAAWEGSFEKAWHLAFGPDGRLTALVRRDDAWTVGVEGALWEERFTFAWNTRFSRDGSAIGAQVKKGSEYTVALDGKSWEKGFVSCRDYAISDDGQRIAAAVQVEELPSADTVKFLEGTWSLAIDGAPWPRPFINVYTPTWSPDGLHVAAQVRVGRNEYTVAQDGTAWSTAFSCVWEPLYRSGSKLLAPVRLQGAWTVAEDGAPLWKGRYVQVWHLRQSPEGKRLAAVVATALGDWTVAVDDVPWSTTVSDMALAPVVGAEGRHVAAAVKDQGRWTIALDGQLWAPGFDMVWDPVFDPSGERVLARVDLGGAYGIAGPRRVWDRRFEKLWDPCFSPDGERVLVRAVEGGKYIREVVPFTSLLA